MDKQSRWSYILLIAIIITIESVEIVRPLNGLMIALTMSYICVNEVLIMCYKETKKSKMPSKAKA